MLPVKFLIKNFLVKLPMENLEGKSGGTILVF